MQCAAYGLSTDSLTPHPFNLCSNAGSTYTSISQTQPLDMTLSTYTQLIWSTMARPVLNETCFVKPLYGLGHHAAYHTHIYVEQQFFFSDPQRVPCHAVPCWTSSDQYERVRAITPNWTHLLPIHTWAEHVSEAERCDAQLNIPLCGRALRSVAHSQSKHSTNFRSRSPFKPNPAQITLWH